MPAAPHHAPDAATRRSGGHTADRILDVAEALFAERGYAATTLRHVATAVGIRTPSLYNHFDGKESLYAAVLERGIGPVLGTLSRFAAEPGGARDSARIVRDVMSWLARRPNIPRLILHETLSGGQHLTPLLRAWIAPAFERAGQMLEANPAARRWEPEQLPLLVLALYHVIVGYFAIAPLYRDLVAGQDLLSEEAVERQTRFLGEVVAALLPARLGSVPASR